MNLKPVFLLSLTSFLFVMAAQASPYQDGDIVFQESLSDQSKAIQEATGSRWSHVGIVFKKRGRWMVAEAVGPVRVTTLAKFIARGKSHDYQIYRLPGLTVAQMKELRKQADGFMGKEYDIYFEWSDDLIYCSEFVFKVFKAATGVEIGSVQKYRDLKLDGPYVKELIQIRLTDTGRALNLEEEIVTPASQITDSKLLRVE